MNIEIHEDKLGFSYKIKFTPSDPLKDVLRHLKEISSQVSTTSSLTYSLYKDEVSSISSQTVLGDFVDNVEEDIEINDEYDDAIIQVDGKKDSKSKTLDIFFIEAFLSKLPDTVEALLEYWHGVFEKYTAINILDSGANANVEFSKSNDEVDTKIINSLELPFDINYTPESTYFLAKEMSAFNEMSTHFKKVTVFYCLKLISSRMLNSEAPQFVFDGYDSSSYKLPNENEIKEIHNQLFFIYEWIFVDNSFAEKLGLARNLISIKKSKTYEDTFNNELVKSLFSNYQIYLKDNLKQYIEVKNKISEFIFTLSNKCTDIHDSYISNSRNAVLAIFSYFFTVIIIKGYSKKSGEPLFTLDIALLSIVFIIAAIYYINMVWDETQKKNKNIKDRINETKTMYENVLHKRDLDEIFNIESLNALIQLNKEAEYHTDMKRLLIGLIPTIIFLYVLQLFKIASYIDWSLFWQHACNIA